MNIPTTSKRQPASRLGVKVLIGALSLAGTIGGWATLGAQPAAAQPVAAVSQANLPPVVALTPLVSAPGLLEPLAPLPAAPVVTFAPAPRAAQPPAPVTTTRSS